MAYSLYYSCENKLTLEELIEEYDRLLANLGPKYRRIPSFNNAWKGRTVNHYME